MNRKRFVGILFLLLAAVVVLQIPDIKRYLKISSM